MAGPTIRLAGELLGERGGDPDGAFCEVVRITEEGRPRGAAENAIVLVEASASRGRRARYLSWIGYADLDQASSREPGRWLLLEPAPPYEQQVEWVPFCEPSNPSRDQA